MKPARYAIFVLLLLSAQLISCGEEAAAPTETNAVPETTTAVETVTEAPKDSLPNDLDFGGVTVNMFMRDDMPLAEFKAVPHNSGGTDALSGFSSV